MSSKKINCAVIGSGNIGTDLMYKLLRSKKLNLTTMIGIDSKSEGLSLARSKGITTIDNGIDGFVENPELAEIVFEATSAKAHLRNAPILKRLGKKVIDLTPAAIGPFVVPSVELAESDIKDFDNVNMVTCGGQATVPLVKAVSRVVDVEYAEIVSSAASLSAGPGTRQNIDEFTTTTSRAIREVGGAKESKTIILLNPADPPILMRNTVYVKISEHSDEIYKKIKESLEEMVQTVQEYVKGYRFKADTVFKDDIVTISVEVEGQGDYLPSYAGNLDIITAAAVRTGELIADSLTK